ncbi:preprotein translocase subunit YajC [Actinomyces bovis]|uniref:Preprotein translocase subunit YajC n=1 Tax=Actinomyces bovis TaxID=1658 RepID=A0ABY1VRP3_9ACTO|nr:preprotein translocase subunit YajC [Actinomyces bovis]SPT54087.1 preprotein translocase subunit YajC [Actinomyces bovis]VEG53702.1 preprotein translocase subunit YajC [Actinomyces israelii]
MDPTLILMLVIMGGGFWLMTRLARRQQEKMQAEQDRRLEEAMVPGTWVRTHSGFYGKLVEVDGDVVTLATPLGDESLWHKRALLGAEEPPFAAATETAESQTAIDTAAEAPVTEPATNDVPDQQA